MNPSAQGGLWMRVTQRIQWWLKCWRRQVDGWLARRGPRVFIGVHWPPPFRKPFERSQLRFRSEGGGIGDELLCSAIFAEIKRRNPQTHITFFSRYPDFFQGHSQIDVIAPIQEGGDSIMLSYGNALPPPRSLASMMAETIGLQMKFPKIPTPQLRSPIEKLSQTLEAIPGPWIAIQPLSSRWTPNKAWPLAAWETLIRLLTKTHHVVELGTATAFPDHDFGAQFHSLAGCTDLNNFAYALSKAGAFVGPPSGGMHLANAFGVPLVIIFGGYEAPVDYDYPNMESFFTPLKCSPCWLSDKCPYEHECLKAVRPEEVYPAVLRALEKTALPIK